ncbi:MurR/RpiR family transcriptional regulator [[Acholeplasma] multilocale]|uniref:MurR/RpiR family transcriptional regulator n=1 Tax=[Acholeplasma] multilocale TaxID=264638 RepID=UPI00047AA7B7|nr:MurR/RpiR family transcriptional regulator [[Acholeplasma] multilocale]
MKNVIELLEENAIARSHTTYGQISKYILDGYNKGIIYPIKKISAECFVSKSSVTFLAKKIGFAGYREMKYNLERQLRDFQKAEWREQLSFEGDDTFVFNEVKNSRDQILEGLDHQIGKIKHLCDLIRASENVFVFASETFKNEGTTLANDLNLKLKNVNLITEVYYFLKIFRKITEDDLIIILASDNDEEVIHNLVHYVFKNHQNYFLIISKNNNFWEVLDLDKTLTIEDDISKSSLLMSKVVLNYLILQISILTIRK